VPRNVGQREIVSESNIVDAGHLGRGPKGSGDQARLQKRARDLGEHLRRGGKSQVVRGRPDR